ncbi:lycopene cyclase domain-containing protein [Imtechella halotolerans]|uniref:Lycopene cyclase n=1 Tax=Imtechella halotolerans K1 TaxID=946077 RepID=I0WDB3_9FLAO|nr:lycopene cyclase domain-containing protein [Imtechella halotolerans]EID74379.1 lycopene cyclase [Imtechella halotolerans K1]WMQ62265.1 lycopene cyclase domain-containing protein [Imtechella halotolerans]
MKYLYLLLDIGSLSIPFLYSFHPRLKFHKLWPYLFPSIIMTMFIFIPWDIIFTENKFWGFNNDYLSGLYFVNLPIEEWLFFICIPYACIFTHEAFKIIAPGFYLKNKHLVPLTWFLMFTFTIISIVNYDKWYTSVNFAYAVVVLYAGLLWAKEELSRFYATFLVILIPFFIVNGILTGSMIETPIVWYNNEENLGIRLATIPIEDSVYAFTMLFSSILFMHLLRKKFV